MILVTPCSIFLIAIALSGNCTALTDWRSLHIAVCAVFKSAQNFDDDVLGCMITSVGPSDESSAAAPLFNFLLLDDLRLSDISTTSYLFFVACVLVSDKVLSDACEEMKKAKDFDVSPFNWAFTCSNPLVLPLKSSIFRQQLLGLQCRN